MQLNVVKSSDGWEDLGMEEQSVNENNPLLVEICIYNPCYL